MRFCSQDGEHEQERCDDCLIQASVNMRTFLAVFSTVGTAVLLTRLTEGDFALRERTDLAASFAAGAPGGDGKARELGFADFTLPDFIRYIVFDSGV